MAYMFSRILALKEKIPKGLNISIHLYISISIQYIYTLVSPDIIFAIYVHKPHWQCICAHM